MSRLDVSVDDLKPGEPYSLVNACVIPRPIAWVSTVSAAGVANIAPHSFFSVASADPSILMFSSIGEKDTLRNLREVPELVVCITTEALTEQVNRTGTAFPADVDEFAEVGLTPEPSVRVRPARIAESPIALECRLWGTHDFPRSVVVFAEVLHVAIDRAVLSPDGKPDPRLVAPMSRMGRNEWAALGEVSSRSRITWDQWRDGAR